MGLLVVVALSGLTSWGGQSLVHAQETAPAGEELSTAPDEPTLQGSETAAVQRVVREHQGQIKYCYEVALQSDPHLAGRVEVGFTSSDGRVTSTRIARNTTGDGELAECIADRLRRWEFPQGLQGEILYPFVLSPHGGPQPLVGAPKSAPVELSALEGAFWRGRRDDLHACQLTHAPTETGRIEFDLELDAGELVSAKVAHDHIGVPELADCVLEELQQAAFPAAVSGELRFPVVFLFQPAGSGE